MKKTLMGLLGLALLPLVLLLLFAPYLGFVFAVSLITASIIGWGVGMPVALVYFSIGWKVYWGLIVFTFAFLTTFAFQNCCVGIQSFRGHLKHRGWGGVMEDAINSLIWPWGWLQLDHSLRGWGLSFADAFFNAVEYWFVSSWRGVRLSSVDIDTGAISTTYIKTPEDARDAIREAVVRNLDK